MSSYIHNYEFLRFLRCSKLCPAEVNEHVVRSIPSPHYNKVISVGQLLSLLKHQHKQKNIFNFI